MRPDSNARQRSVNQQNYQICDANMILLLRAVVREDGRVETIAPLEGKVFLFC